MGRNFSHMRSKLSIALMLISLWLPGGEPSAHVIYKNLLTQNLDSSGRFYGYLFNNYGWIDGADTAPNDRFTLGNTHNVYWGRFTLPTASHVSIRVSSVNRLPYSIPGLNGTNSIPFRADLAPAFTLYSGLAPALGHDDANPECSSQGSFCHGVLDVLDTFELWNSWGSNATLQYLGHAVSKEAHPRFAARVFRNLPAGNYTVVVGGGKPEGIPDGSNMLVGIRAFSVLMAVVPREAAPSGPSLGREQGFSGTLAMGSETKRYRVDCKPSPTRLTDRYWFSISSLSVNAPSLKLTVERNRLARTVTDPHSGDLAFSNWASVRGRDGAFYLTVSRDGSSGATTETGQTFRIRHACGTNRGNLTVTSSPRALD